MNITKRAFIALTALALAGCASVSGLRENGPSTSMSSKHSVADVVTCISGGWQTRREPTRMLPIAGGQSLQADNPALAGSPVAIVDVTATDSGSQTEFYKQGVAADVYLDTAKSCQ